MRCASGLFVWCWVLGALLWACSCTGQLPHQRLGVAPNTPPAELKRAYRKRCLELHPDKHKGEANKAWAEQEFMALGKAYETLLAEAVRRYQGASSRPTRAGAGGGREASGEEDRRRRTREQPPRQTDDSRQTSSDREKAERHRREQERRAAGAGRSRGGREGQDRQSAEARRQREREREFRRLQEEERRWQEHARRRQQQHRQQQYEWQKRHGGYSGHDTEARLRAEREQLEREERHRREKMRRQKAGNAGRQGSQRGGSQAGPEEGRSAMLERQLRELAKGAQLVAFSMATEGTWAAIGHTSTHLLYVEAMPSLPQPVSAVSIALSRVEGVKTGNNGKHVQIELKEDDKGVRQSPLQVVVGHHDLKSLTNLMDSLTRHCPEPSHSQPPDGNTGREEAPGAGGERSAENAGGGSGAGDGERAAEGGGGEELPTLMLVDNGLEMLNDAYIRLSSIDGLEVLALTNTHLIHVMLPVPSAAGVTGQAEVLRSPLLYITNVRSTSTGGLMIELGSSGAWEPIEMDAQHFPLPQLQHFFNTLHAAVLAAQRAQVESDARFQARAPRLSHTGQGVTRDPSEGALDAPSDSGHGAGPGHVADASGSDAGVNPLPPPGGAGDKSSLREGDDATAGRGEQQQGQSIQELMGMARTSLSSKDGRHLVMITAEDLMHVKAEDMAANVVSFHGKLRLVDKVSTTEQGRLRVELKSEGEYGELQRHAEGDDTSSHRAALELDPQVFEMDALSDLFEQLYLAVVRAGGSYTGRAVADDPAHEIQSRASDRGSRMPPPPGTETEGAHTVEDGLLFAQNHGNGDSAAPSAARARPLPPPQGGIEEDEGGSTSEPSETCTSSRDDVRQSANVERHDVPGNSRVRKEDGDAGDRSGGGQDEEEEDEVGSLSWRLQALEKELHLDEEELGAHEASVEGGEVDAGRAGVDMAAESNVGAERSEPERRVGSVQGQDGKR